MVAARLRCVALQTAEAAKAVGMARPPARPRTEQELAPPTVSGVVDLHRDSHKGPSGQQHREALKLWLDDVVESCEDTVGVLFEVELARACSLEEAGPSSSSGVEDDWHLHSRQGEYTGSTQRRSRAARQSGSRAGPRGGGPAQRAPAPLFAGRGDALGDLEGGAELDWQAAVPWREDRPGLTRSVWSLDELAEEWYDTSRTVRDIEPSEAEACLAGAACR